MKESPGKKFARKFMEKIDRPLTEDDIAHAYTKGSQFGRSSMWYKVATMSPSSSADEQIVVLFDMGQGSYDMKVVTGDKYAEFIADRSHEGTPVFWAYLSAMIGARFKHLKYEKG